MVIWIPIGIQIQIKVPCERGVIVQVYVCGVKMHAHSYKVLYVTVFVKEGSLGGKSRS